MSPQESIFSTFSRQNNATADSFNWNLSGLTDSSRKTVGGGVLSKIRYAYRFDGTDTATTTQFSSLAGDPILALSINENTFDLIGIVRWTTETASSGIHKIGIQFLDTSPDKAAWNKLIEHLLSQRG